MFVVEADVDAVVDSVEEPVKAGVVVIELDRVTVAVVVAEELAEAD